MKRGFAVILALVMLLGICFEAQAGYSYVNTGLKMSMATRSGPGTGYNELGTYFNDYYNQTLKAFSRYSNNGVWWVQVEFSYRGMLYRAYTGQQRLTIDSDVLPTEQQIGTGRITSGYSFKAYTGPGANYAQTAYSVPASINCDVYDVDNGYAQIDYFDTASRFRHRCWVPMESISISYFSGYQPYSAPTATPSPTPTATQGTYNPQADWSGSYQPYNYDTTNLIVEGDVFIWTGSEDTGFTVNAPLDEIGHTTITLTILDKITYHNLDVYMDTPAQGSFMTLDGREGVLTFYEYYATLKMNLNFAGMGDEIVLLRY